MNYSELVKSIKQNVDEQCYITVKERGKKSKLETIKQVKLTKEQLREIVDVVFDTITGYINTGESVNIKNFGCFDLKTVKGRPFKNFQTGEMDRFGDVKIPKFRCSKTWRNNIGKVGENGQ